MDSSHPHLQMHQGVSPHHVTLLPMYTLVPSLDSTPSILEQNDLPFYQRTRDSPGDDSKGSQHVHRPIYWRHK